MVLADAGVLYALIDETDQWHERTLAWWRASTDEVRVPVTVLPEVTYMLGRRLGARAESDFVREVAAGEFLVEPLEPEDLGRTADVMDAYADFPVGFVDASIVAIAERLGVTSVLTTDRRHFGVVRPAHCPRLRLLP